MKNKQTKNDNLNEKYYRDLKNSLDTSFEEGKIEGEQIGLEKGKIEKEMEVIKNGHEAGLSVTMLAKLTHLTEAQVNKVLKSLGLI